MPTQQQPTPSLVRLCLLLSILAGLAGCKSGPIVGSASKKEAARARRMTSLVKAYTRDMDWAIQRAADRIAAETADFEIGRNSVNWKLRSIPMAYEINRRINKTEAFVGLWVLTEMMHDYMTEDGGRKLFGDQQHIAIEATAALKTEVRELVVEVVDPERVEEAIADVEKFTHEHKNYESAGMAIKEFTSSNTGALAWIPTIDLTAFNPFGGLNESAEAIRFFTNKTEAAVQDMSRQLPWKLEVLAYDMEQRESTAQALEGWDRLSISAESLAGTASALPADVRKILTTTLDEIDEKQAGLRQTIGEANTAIVNADGAIVNANEALTTAVTVTEGLDATASHLTEAGAAWEATFRTLGLVPPEERVPDPDEEPSEPFDINDYKDTAVVLQNTAVELRGLVEEVNTLASGSGEGTALGNVGATLDTTLADATERGRQLVDHITVRLIQFLGLALLAGVLYRLVTNRLIPRRPAST